MKGGEQKRTDIMQKLKGGNAESISMKVRKGRVLGDGRKGNKRGE